jgi:hypothetical protein
MASGTYFNPKARSDNPSITPLASGCPLSSLIAFSKDSPAVSKSEMQASKFYDDDDPNPLRIPSITKAKSYLVKVV